MKVGSKKATVFKIQNRKGYAAVCANHLTEGRTKKEALERMGKALRRTSKKRKK